VYPSLDRQVETRASAVNPYTKFTIKLIS
jgi:hypothetical protein